jgi:hypothetical protein
VNTIGDRLLLLVLVLRKVVLGGIRSGSARVLYAEDRHCRQGRLMSCVWGSDWEFS